MVRPHPFLEKEVDKDIFIRVFSGSIEEEDLLWHWDEEDRVVYSIHETDWKFQRDNSLPQNIEGEIFIRAGEWHRLIKGTGDLKVKVKKIKV